MGSLFGTIVGLIARAILPGNNNLTGFVLTATIGIAGSIAVTFLGFPIGWNQAGSLVGFIGAAVNAIIVLGFYYLAIDCLFDFYYINHLEFIMGFEFGNLIKQVVSGNGPALADIENQFAQVAQGSDSGLLKQGLTAMFHSDQTPPFAQMAAQLFGQANSDQKAGMLNHLLSGIGPGALSALVGGSGGATLAGILGQFGGSSNSVTPDQAAQLTSDQVQQLAAYSQQQNPEIVEHMSGFFAQHSGLIKTLGGAALTIALSKMTDAQKSS